MKAIQIPNEGCWRIEKGKTVIDIFPGQDKFPYKPTRIRYENRDYPLKVGLITAIDSFKECYSEEQVFEKLLELTVN